MGKKKSSAISSSNKKAPATSGYDEEDWDDILNEMKQENEAILAAAVVESVQNTADIAVDGEENGNDNDDVVEQDEGGAGATKKAKKKKKKKPAAAASEEGTSSTTPTVASASGAISARGRLVAERLRIQREEEERLKRLQEEEDQRIAELEAKEAEELRKKEEEKERKKQKQKEKIERQKMEGTYMTKAQKQKAKLAAERLEAMKAAGMLPTTTLATNENNSSSATTTTATNQAKLYKKQKQLLLSKKKEDLPPSSSSSLHQEQKQPHLIPQEEIPESYNQQPTHEKGEKEENEFVQDHVHDKKKEEDSILDEWDAESFDSSDHNLAQLEAKLQQVNTSLGEGINAKGVTQVVQQQDEEEEEDLIAAERKQELERLRILGIEREKREKMEAEKRAAFLAEQEELKRQEALAAQKKAEGKKRRMEQEKANLLARTRDHLRCPVVVIMGHVDTGKTKLLDKIRHTNVQEGEAGGITQQIGATFFEKKTLEQQTSRLNRTEQVTLTIPGMLVIDTPGHESFSNLRSRGSSLCDIAILVVDLMHGLEPQTIESLNMLRSKGTPFVVALNKIDRCYAWVTCPDAPIREALEKQTESTVSEFRSRASQAKLELAQQGVNSNIYWEMGDDDWENSVCYVVGCIHKHAWKRKENKTRESHTLPAY